MNFRWQIFLSFFLTGSLFALPSLLHVPPSPPTAGEVVKIHAVIISDSPVIVAKVIHRIPGQKSFHEIDMVLVGETWQVTIPSIFVTENGLEYSILVELEDGSVLGFPKEDPLHSPYSLPVLPTSKPPKLFEESKTGNYLKADILIISPEEGGMIPPSDVLIVASLFNIQNIDLSSVRLWLDGANVTADALITEELITYVPEEIESGFHTIKIELRNIFGMIIEPVTWSFTVASPAARIVTASEEFSYQGKVRTDYSLERVEDNVLSINQGRIEFQGGWNWLNFSTDLRLTSDESEYKQPRNRYAFEIKSGENILVYLGDFTPVLSSYTINGKRVRGLGVDVDLDWIRFQLVQGELERAIQGRPGTDQSVRVTNIKSDGSGVPVYVLDRLGYTFSRQYQAYRIGLHLFNRFRLGFNLQKAKDIIASVATEIKDAKFTVPDWADYVSETGIDSGVYSFDEFKNSISGIGSYELDNAHWGGDSPQDNLVLGFDTGISFDNQRLNFDIDWAISFRNKDIWDGALTLTQMDTALDDSIDGFIARTYDDYGLVTSLGFSLEQMIDPSTFKDFFIVNENMIPLVPIDIDTYKKSPLSAVLNMPSTAYKFRMQAYYYENTLQLQYSQIGPEFISLANPYLPKNLREFLLTDRIRLFDNKLAIRLTYKHRDNKILGSTVNPYSQNTLSSNFALVPGIGMPTFTFDMQSVHRDNGNTELDSLIYTTSSGKDSLVLEDLREDTKTITTTMTISIPLQSDGMNYHLVGSFNTIDIKDLLEDFRKKDYSSPNSNSRSFSFSVTMQSISSLKTSFNISRYILQLPGSYSISGEGVKESRILKLGFDGSYKFYKGKFRGLGGINYMKTSGVTKFAYYGANIGLEFPSWKSFSARGIFSGNIKQAEKEIRLGTLSVKLVMNYLF